MFLLLPTALGLFREMVFFKFGRMRCRRIVVVSDFKIDCRSNPTHKGDLFSWQAVYELRNEFCPYPWRVPKKQDFIDLDIALGGTGQNFQEDLVRTNKYLNNWGANFSGHSDARGNLGGQRSWAIYWSQSSHGNEGFFFQHGRRSISPQLWADKSAGLALRCVRDNQ